VNGCEHITKVTVLDGAVVLVDLGSTNGTYVNKRRIVEPTTLEDGDRIRLSNTIVKFLAGS